jgi:hypothetical protein
VGLFRKTTKDYTEALELGVQRQDGHSNYRVSSSFWKNHGKEKALAEDSAMECGNGRAGSAMDCFTIFKAKNYDINA